MSGISISKLVASFSIKLDRKSLKEIDDVLKKYSNKKIVQTIKISSVVDKNQKKELAGAKALQAIDLRRFNAVKFINALEKEKQKVLRQQLKTEERISKEKAKQAIADTKSQAALMRSARPRMVNGQTIEQRIAGTLQGRGLRQTSGGVLRPATGSGGTSRSQHALGLGRNSPGASYHGVMAGGGLLTGFGLTALNNRLAQMQSNQVGLQTVAGSPEEYQKQKAFLRRLGANLGATQAELVPEYTKFFANAQGTALEPHAQSGFSSLTQYGKVIGLDAESMKGTFRAVSQMVN